MKKYLTTGYIIYKLEVVDNLFVFDVAKLDSEDNWFHSELQAELYIENNLAGKEYGTFHIMKSYVTARGGKNV